MKQRFLKTPSDKALIKGIAEKDHTVLHTLYERYFPMICKMVLQNSGNEEEAKDLFQEALLVLYNKSKKKDFVLTAQLQTYIYAVCRRLWLKQLQHRQKDPIYPGNAVEETMPDVEEDVEDHEQKEQQFEKMNEAMDQLGSPCKELLEDFYVNQLSMQQLVEKYGYTNTDNAKTQKYKCLQRLKKIFFSSK